jgi:hypothetical protein
MATFCFFCWVFIGIASLVLVSRGRDVPKLSYFCAILIVLFHFAEHMC